MRREDPREAHRALARVALCCDYPGKRGGALTPMTLR